MKNFLLTLTIVSTIFTGCGSKKAQAPAEFADAASRFETFYNAGQFDSIFVVMFADTLQKALPLENTLALFQGIQNQAGDIKNMEFTQLNFGAAIFRTEFEKGVMNVTISLDEEGKMNGLWLKP